MSKSTDGETVVKNHVLNGYVIDTRNVWYSEVIEKAKDIGQKSQSQSSYIKMKCLLDRGTELRNKYIGENLDKIPFDLFVENKNSNYFIEVKTKTKSDSKYFSFNETETIGLWAAKDCEIPVYFIFLYAQETDLREYVPEFEFFKIVSYKGRPLPLGNRAFIKRLLNNRNFFEFDSCDKDTCEKVIKEEFLDLII